MSWPFAMEADNSLVGGAPQRIIFRSVEPGRGWAMPGADGLVGGTAVSAAPRQRETAYGPREQRPPNPSERRVQQESISGSAKTTSVKSVGWDRQQSTRQTPNSVFSITGYALDSGSPYRLCFANGATGRAWRCGRRSLARCLLLVARGGKTVCPGSWIFVD